MDTTLANWTKVSCGCSSSLADAKFLGSTPIDGIVVLTNHRSSVEIILSQFLYIDEADGMPKAEPQSLKKYKKYTPGSTNIENVIGNVIDFLYFLCTFESTKPGNKSTWFPGSFE
jgi:hypothetical protein